MKKAYIYPISGRDEKNLGLYNPYIDDFIQSSSRFYQFVNEDSPSKTGILNVTRYIFKLDYLFLNWIEKVPELKWGVLQTYFVLLLMPMCKVFGVRLIWTMHNKLAHTSNRMGMKRKIFKSLLKHADAIITHSSDGIAFGEEMVKGSGSKIFYLPHPVKDRRMELNTKKEYDILIWGTMAPYKGIDLFLEFLASNNLLDRYSIRIIGKISSPEYEKKLRSYASDKIVIKDAFLSEDELYDFISKARIVLFTYSTASILSSGVLMDSLGFGANIVGPTVGAFADLGKEGILSNYSDFPDMTRKIDDRLNENSQTAYQERLDEFLKNNVWDRFAENMSKKL